VLDKVNLSYKIRGNSITIFENSEKKKRGQAYYLKGRD
jgi:hypothetical protein